MRLVASECPTCGKLLDDATGLDRDKGFIEDAIPSEGDVSVCLGCGAFNQFDADLKLTHMSFDDVVDMHPTDRTLLFAARSAWQNMKEAGSLPPDALGLKRCPIGLDEHSELCSAGTCWTCVTRRFEAAHN